MSTSFWLDKSSQTPLKKSDIVIVGGGITGLSLAYWIQKKDPNLSVTILEKGKLGSGATGRNAGFVTCGSVEHFNRMVSKHGEATALEIWRFAEENLRLLKEHIIRDSGDDLGFRQRGAYSLAAQDSELSELKSVAQLMTKHQISVESLSGSEIRSRVGAEGFVGGIRYCNDGEIHPIRLLERLRSEVKASIHENTTVHNIEATDGGAREVLTDSGSFEGQIVVLAANGYSASLHPYFKEKIYPTRGQMLMFEPVAPFMDAPCYANFYLDYFRQMPGGELLIGGFRQIEKATEVGYSDHTTETVQAALQDFVASHLPQFKGRRVTHRWAGVMGFSQDGEPMVGSLPDDNQIYFAGGYTGHGLGMAFHVAKNCVDLIFGDSVPDWLSSRRF